MRQNQSKRFSRHLLVVVMRGLAVFSVFAFALYAQAAVTYPPEPNDVTVVYLQTPGCADDEIPLADNTSPTGWVCDDGVVLNLWQTDGTNVWRSTGNVGIGTATPGAKLDLDVPSSFAGALIEGGYDINATVTPGDFSVALGYSNATQGKYSFAIGRGNQANGPYDMATGYQTITSGNYSTTFGYQTEASGAASMAMGHTTLASGLDALAIGRDSVASATEGIAHGGGVASGYHSVALGLDTEASGSTAVALGRFTVASNFQTTAIGNESEANAQRATVIGNYSLASGTGAMAVGYGVEARALYSTVVGSYNVPSGTTGSWVSSEPIFQIGNGPNDASRSNAVTVLKNGRVGIGTDAPESGSLLDVEGDIEMNGHMLMSNYIDSGNIDHLWHDDGLNRWFFNSDTTAKNDKATSGVAARGYYQRDWDTTAGSNDNTYRLIGRDNTWMFYNGGVAIGQWGDAALSGASSPPGTGDLVVKNRVSIGYDSVYEALAVNGDIYAAGGNGYDELYFDGNGYGLESYGWKEGGYFRALEDGSRVWLARGENGTGPQDVGYGVYAWGTKAGGYFADMHSPSDDGVALLGYGDRGIYAYGSSYGALFNDTNNSDVSVYLAYGSNSVYANGPINVQESGSPALYVAGDEAVWYNGTYFSWGYGSAGAASNYFNGWVGLGDTTPNARLDVEGTIYYNAIAQESDARLKTDVVSIGGTALNDIMKLNPVSYYWIGGSSDPKAAHDDKLHLGFIAQDVEKIYPSLISMDGKYKTLSYPELIAPTVAALQELKREKDAEIEGLKTQLETVTSALCSENSAYDFCNK